jgi:hypothetical protein
MTYVTDTSISEDRESLIKFYYGQEITSEEGGINCSFSETVDNWMT